MATINGTSGNDTLTGDTNGGAGQANSINGQDGNDSLAGLLLNDTLLGGAGNDTIAGLTGDDSIDSGTGADSVTGGVGNDFLTGTGNGATLAGGLGSDTITFSGDNSGLTGSNDFGPDQGSTPDLIRFNGNNNTVYGNNGDDTVYFEGGSGNLLAGGNQVDTLYVTGGFQTVSTGSSGGNAYTIIQTPDGNSTIGGFESVIGVICFAAGTDILTANGEIMVDDLSAGDLVATVSGRGAPMKPVLWVGRRRITLAGNPNAAALSPVRIKAGALGDCTPHRDLLVSPDHCLFLDGALVPARLLVNGSSIVAEQGLAEVTYFHVELENHDVLLAHGAAAESWLDADNRAWFENASVASIQVTDAQDAYGTGRDEARTCAPVLQGGGKLAAIRDAIALRASAATVPAEAPLRAVG